MLNEFKQFIMRGNAIDLAVGVVMGAAFTGIVKAIVTYLIGPIISLLAGAVDLSSLKFSIGPAVFKYGIVLNEIINFVMVGFVIFLIIKAINKFFKKNEKKEEVESGQEIQLLTEIRNELKKTNQSTNKA
ncbi:large-conductance mechanosensitive channel protein MscL [Oenococcus sicerae]|uniref:Large-conductance mechanosensitive channel n=1 Tax=Oenococcus sicerae TaxID=2203724 RepID=A0AAJ1RB31_9LACO|nr:large-conductance mechanosensitive channel protein MscL [Oenococcus sicerae]MDN6899532.1 large-conductance mechanosensitive channel protein MscL [Oenococcus sicerae]QAS70226.1 large-conductance mechanosensitive channel protein MscL [Oenococcus sicerae]